MATARDLTISANKNYYYYGGTCACTEVAWLHSGTCMHPILRWPAHTVEVAMHPLGPDPTSWLLCGLIMQWDLHEYVPHAQVTLRRLASQECPMKSNSVSFCLNHRWVVHVASYMALDFGHHANAQCFCKDTARRVSILTNLYHRFFLEEVYALGKEESFQFWAN